MMQFLGGLESLSVVLHMLAENIMDIMVILAGRGDSVKSILPHLPPVYHRAYAIDEDQASDQLLRHQRHCSR